MKPCALVLLLILASIGCGEHRGKPAPQTLHVACAANLTSVIPRLIRSFASLNSGTPQIVASFGATAQLEQQIENGAPFDVFLAADVQHIQQLVSKRLARRGFLYARGRLAVYSLVPARLQDLQDPRFRQIAIANPELAPFGKASLQALQRSGDWPKVQSRVVYAQNIAEVKTYVDTGNAEAGLTALSLLPAGKGTEVDPNLYDPVLQSGCVLLHSEFPGEAQRFAAFLGSPAAVVILRDAGYAAPALK